MSNSIKLSFDICIRLHVYLYRNLKIQNFVLCKHSNTTEFTDETLFILLDSEYLHGKTALQCTFYKTIVLISTRTRFAYLSL